MRQGLPLNQGMQPQDHVGCQCPQRSRDLPLSTVHSSHLQQQISNETLLPTLTSEADQSRSVHFPPSAPDSVEKPTMGSAACAGKAVPTGKRDTPTGSLGQGRGRRSAHSLFGAGLLALTVYVGAE